MKILKSLLLQLFPLDTVLDNLECRYMTGIILLSIRSCFTINITILFTFISLKVVEYMITTLLERLSNKNNYIT